MLSVQGHTTECRQRFESLLAENVKVRKQFKAAQERRLNAITKKATEMQEEVEEREEAVKTGTSTSSGSASGLCRLKEAEE